MSIAPSSSPSSRWSRGSKPSAAKSRGLPISSTTVKSFSPPTGASSETRFGSLPASSLKRVSASAAAASLAFTSAASVLVRSSSAVRSSPLAWATCLPSPFCSARSDSNAAMDDRRSPSAARTWSTRSVLSPRLVRAARTTSGFSRSNLASITQRGYRGVSRAAKWIRDDELVSPLSDGAFRGGFERAMNHHPPTQVGRALTVVLGVLPVTIVTLLVFGEWPPLRRWDLSVAAEVAEYGAAHQNVVQFWEVVSAVTVPWTARGIMVVVAAYFWHRRARLLAVWLVVTAGAELGLAQAVKHIFDRPRPAQMLVEADGWSYVSGHATAAFVLAGALGVVLPSVRGWR